MTAPVNTNNLAWGFSTLGCAELSFPQICKLLRDFDLHELEIRGVDGRIDLPQWAVDAGWSPSRAIAALKKQDVHFRVAGSSFKLVSNDEASRAEMVAFCTWADSWGAQYVRAFGGGTGGQALTESDYDRGAQTVAWWQQEKKRHGWEIELLLETHDSFSASGPCRELFARLREPIGIIWDSHHTWRTGDESPRESWSQLSQWIRHVHIKDSISKPSARHPFTYVLPGKGETPLGEIVEILREHHFTGMISLEWERLWHPYLPPLREALTRLQAQPWFLASTEAIHEVPSPTNAR